MRCKEEKTEKMKTTTSAKKNFNLALLFLSLSSSSCLSLSFTPLFLSLLPSKIAYDFLYYPLNSAASFKFKILGTEQTDRTWPGKWGMFSGSIHTHYLRPWRVSLFHMCGRLDTECVCAWSITTMEVRERGAQGTKSIYASIRSART